MEDDITLIWEGGPDQCCFEGFTKRLPEEIRKDGTKRTGE
jgi:hypothetical protein